MTYVYVKMKNRTRLNGLMELNLGEPRREGFFGTDCTDLTVFGFVVVAVRI